MAGNISDAQNPLNCSVCLGLFKDPVTTSCGHSFCKDCIGRFWDRSHQRVGYNCPTCRQPFNKRPTLSRSTVLAELVEERRRIPEAGPGDVECDVCTGRKLKAIKSCLECLASYCQIHVQSEILKSHNLVNATPNLQQQICSQHHKALEIYCHDDQKCICVECINEHRGHNIFSAVKEMADKKEELKIKKNVVIQNITEIKRNVQELNNTVKIQKDSAQAAAKHSDKIFSELIRSIRKKNKEVSEVITAQEMKETTKVQDHIQKLNQEISDLQKENIDLELLLQTEDHINFFQNYASRSETPMFPVLQRTFNNLVRFGDVEKSVTELKRKLDEVCKEHIGKILRKVNVGDVQISEMSVMIEPVSSPEIYPSNLSSPNWIPMADSD